MEEWRPVKDFPEYLVSNLGNVRSKRFPDQNLQPGTMRGWHIVNLNGMSKKVSRLVAEVFIPNPENKPTVDHINNIRDDDRVENLRWATHSEQCFNRQCFTNNKLQEKNISEHLASGCISIRYRVRKAGLKTKYFKTLEEAIDYRDSI